MSFWKIGELVSVLVAALKTARFPPSLCCSQAFSLLHCEHLCTEQSLPLKSDPRSLHSPFTMPPQTTIPLAANILGTIGTFFWCFQLIPQIWHNWRNKSTEGLPGLMMFLFALCESKRGIYTRAPTDGGCSYPTIRCLHGGSGKLVKVPG